MKLSIQKIKLSLALVCICSMAAIVGVPVLPKEKIEQITRADNQNVAMEVAQARDEQQ